MEQPPDEDTLKIMIKIMSSDDISSLSLGEIN